MSLALVMKKPATPLRIVVSKELVLTSRCKNVVEQVARRWKTSVVAKHQKRLRDRKLALLDQEMFCRTRSENSGFAQTADYADDPNRTFVTSSGTAAGLTRPAIRRDHDIGSSSISHVRTKSLAIEGRLLGAALQFRPIVLSWVRKALRVPT